MKNTFYQLLADLKNKAQVKLFLKDFLTESELNTLANRLAIIKLLNQGKSYAEINKKLKVSSATIASTANLLNKKGSKLAIEKIKLDEWVEKIIGKIIW
ncbi:MAG: Trp family transcriptional regulator [Patescibacteria group bacterium]